MNQDSISRNSSGQSSDQMSDLKSDLIIDQRPDHISEKKASQNLEQYPDQGEFFLAEKKGFEKKSDTLIFFVHFFQGHKKALKRHFDLVNELGFDAYGFKLKDAPKTHWYVPYSSQSHKFGMKHALADQIEQHLKIALKKYNKILIFAFSNIAGCAIEATARRFKQNQNEIIGYVCDSGPGLDFLKSSYHLLLEQIGVKSFPLRLMTTPLFAAYWSPSLHKDLYDDLKCFPQHFPLLSIRGWRDKLISPQSIDKVFEPHTHLNWQKLSLPEAGHLNGLRDFPSEYCPGLEEFLSQFIETSKRTEVVNPF